MKFRLTFLLLFVLLWCGLAIAQDDQINIGDPQPIDTSEDSVGTRSATAQSNTGYNVNGTQVLIDNRNNCVTRNCWIRTTIGSLANQSVGEDGFHLGVNSYKQVYHLPFANSATGAQGAWQYISALNGVVSVAVVNSTQVYGIKPDNSVVKSNAALTAWSVPNASARLTQLSAAANGVLGGVYGTSAFYSTNGGVSYTHFGGSWKKIVVVNANTAYGISAGNVYKINLPAQTWVWMGIGNIVDITAGFNDIMVSDNTYATWYRDLNSASTAWKKMRGFQLGLAGSGPYVFGLSSGQPYHFNAVAIKVSAKLDGAYTLCATSQPACTGGYHTGTVSVNFADGGSSGSIQSGTSLTVNPQGYLSASTWDFDPYCDPTFGVPSGACGFTFGGSVICTVMGSVFSVSFNLFFNTYFDVAEERVTMIAGSAHPSTSGNGTTSYYVNPWCIAGHSANNLEIINESAGIVAPAFWDTINPCWRFLGAWHCAGIAKSLILTQGVNLPKADCTVLP